MCMTQKPHLIFRLIWHKTQTGILLTKDMKAENQGIIGFQDGNGSKADLCPAHILIYTKTLLSDSSFG